MDSSRALRSTVATVAATVFLTGGTAAVANADQDPGSSDRIGASPAQEHVQAAAGEDALSAEEMAELQRLVRAIEAEPGTDAKPGAQAGPGTQAETATQAEADTQAATDAKHAEQVKLAEQVEKVKQIRWRPTTPTTPKVRNKSLAFRLVLQRSWSRGQFRCLDNLWTRESNWNHRATNRSSGAYGIPQALPAWKMRGAGRDWRFNPKTQIRWGLKYIRGRYGSPCGAWAHSRMHGWY
jgi:hypothetical protein